MLPYPGLVLLVDDDHDDHEIFCLSLGEVSSGIKCIYHDNALSALEYLKQKSINYPDFIFLDLNMPGMNGMQLLEQIKNEEALEAIPIVVYSTSILPSDKEKVLGLRANYFFIKPSSHKELTEELKTVFSTIKREPVL